VVWGAVATGQALEQDFLGYQIQVVAVAVPVMVTVVMGVVELLFLDMQDKKLPLF
jgi:hypothetical protein